MADGPSRIPWDRTLASDALNRAKYVGSLSPNWRIRIKGNATTPGSGTCVFADGTTLTFAASGSPTTAQFGVTYAATGIINVFDGSTGATLGFGNTTGFRVVYNANTAQGLIPQVTTASATQVQITLLTGAAGATATAPSATAWTLDIEAYDSI